ncbi:MAG TPA: hypothetical protein VEU50_35285 [Archangium sp.]|nr:hypothetical protein [Archangium sp.]
MSKLRMRLSSLSRMVSVLRLSPSPLVVIAALLTVLAFAIVITHETYALKIKWGPGEFEMWPVASERLPPPQR